MIMEEWKKLMDCRTIVVKTGSSTLTFPNGRLNYHRLMRLAETMSAIQRSGKKLILVSSGAIAVGSGRMGINSKPADLADKQALAAIGQAELIRIYRRFFDYNCQKVAQVLLTKDIVINHERRVNASNTLAELLKMDIIPIVNENDTVATDEIEFGDNDTLSSYVAELAGADLLVLLSDIDGLFTADPTKDQYAKLIRVVNRLTEDMEKSAAGSSTGFGTGGMAAKIAAARICRSADIKVVIANGSRPGILSDILQGNEAGTLFTWDRDPVKSARPG